jgi:galactokinase
MYGRPATHVVRAPGRVNLIGEHIDYHDLPVMPFAIDAAVYVVFAAAERQVAGSASRVRISSAAGSGESVQECAVDSPADDFQADEFRLDSRIERLPGGDWRNYVRAAARSLRQEQGAGIGVDAWVVSDLPVAVGLSSSSALVVGVGLALARANECLMGGRAFAQQMAGAERFTGTEGGGMDQAASLLSKMGCVSRIGFAPLSVEHVPFPDDLRVMLANSGDTAEKSGGVQDQYNERRETGTGALVVVSEALGVGAPESYSELLADRDVGEVLEFAEGALDQRALSRFRHVVTEWERVRGAKHALEAGEFAELGRLLFASHQSLRDDYEVSTPTLDRLVEAARRAGALGARVTGAGFGGSVVVLATKGTEREVRDAMVEATGSEAAVMSVRPSDGASVMEM